MPAGFFLEIEITEQLNSAPTFAQERLMKRIMIIAACVLLAGPAAAQSIGEKTGVVSLPGVPPSTADFVTGAADGDMFEIQSSRMAASKT